MILDRHSLRPLKSLTASMYTSNISTSPDHAGSLEFVVIVVTTMLTGQKTGVARGPKQHVRSTPSAQTGGQFSGRSRTACTRCSSTRTAAKVCRLRHERKGPHLSIYEDGFWNEVWSSWTAVPRIWSTSDASRMVKCSPSQVVKCTGPSTQSRCSPKSSQNGRFQI